MPPCASAAPLASAPIRTATSTSAAFPGLHQPLMGIPMTDLLPLVDNQKLISCPNPYATLTRRHQKLRKPPFRLILINPMRGSKRGGGQGNGQAAQAIVDGVRSAFLQGKKGKKGDAPFLARMCASPFSFGLPYSNIYVTIPPGIHVAEYPDRPGRASFRRCFDDLDAVAAVTATATATAAAKKGSPIRTPGSWDFGGGD